MLRLGIIGTNWITSQFVEAARSTGEYELTAVYSRREETAKKFADDNRSDARLFTDLDEFFAAPDFDVVYIASPNSMHAQQATQALNAGKNVIVEKPMVTNINQMAGIDTALKNHPELFIFEAARHIYEDNFQRVSDFTHTHPISGATLTYMKYSSRYDAFLAGKDPNVFTTKFGGGALEDLGVYLVYAAISWFGVPVKANYSPQILRTGVDGSGVLHLDYPDFAVNLVTGKTTQSYLPSEIYSGRDTLTIDAPESIQRIDYTTGDGTADLAGKQDKNPMVREAAYFAKAINTGDTVARDSKLLLAKKVHTLMTQVRKDAGIDFAND
ncbi:Gfo/Idh/MocA family protein [Lacticaseibacillus hulanensis]|uniref:Gfo/Idh/MocA family protein n=1 Tax=Lacticaseibacillus hulanensis TaxID=2493111 RepID=UPI000FD84707|nr:Gfo/Idh/MocA family oxidoreductase [Lacticaseibacillus hulanensis]